MSETERTGVEASPVQWNKWDYLLRNNDALDLAKQRVGRLRCVEQAFFLGYQVALARCFSHIVRDEVTALCVSERGSKPKEVQTRFRAREDGQWELSGHKSFVTAPTMLDSLLISARFDDQPGDAAHGRLSLAVVSPTADGVEMTTKENVRIFPELEQGDVLLTEAVIPNSNIVDVDFADVAAFGVMESLTCTLCALSYFAAHPLLEPEHREGAQQQAVSIESLLGLHGPTQVLRVADMAEDLSAFLGAVARGLKPLEGSEDPEISFHARNIRAGMPMFGFRSPLWEARIAKAKRSQSAA